MKRKTLKNIGILCLVVVVSGVLIGYRMYTKPHRSAADEKAEAIPAIALASAYEANEKNADKKYLGRALRVGGTVSEVVMNQQHQPVIILSGTGMSGVQCTMTDTLAPVTKGQPVVIEGFCSGFLSDVILNNCLLVSAKEH